MITRQIEIVNKKGLHARAAAKLINLAHQYDSDIYVSKGGSEVSGKSILGLLMLAAHQGCWITIKAKGADEETAVDSIANLVESKFEESD